MSKLRRVVVGLENEDGSTTVWRMDSDYGGLVVNEDYSVYLLGPAASNRPRFDLHVSGYGERIDTEGPIDVVQLPVPPAGELK